MPLINGTGVNEAVVDNESPVTAPPVLAMWTTRPEGYVKRITRPAPS
jgi:hypothetical protein